MGQLKFISREKLVEYLDEELRHYFNGCGLYEINQYGWLSDGEHDPEYLGHAMWQENPPEHEKLSGLGEEFVSLMRSSRHSLGLTCLYRDAADPLVNDSGSVFSYHFADTVSKLRQASDRIREFFVAAFSQCSPGQAPWLPIGQVIQEGRVDGAFRLPFQQVLVEAANNHLAGPSLEACLKALLPLADELGRNHAKNHDPSRSLSVFNQRLMAVVTNLALGYPDEAMADDWSAAAASSSQELVDWYVALVKLSNQVFLAEHLLRQVSKRARVAPKGDKSP